MSQTTEPTTTVGSPDRVAQFKADVADMKLRDPRAGRDRFWGIAGAVLMAAGIGIAIVAYFSSSGARTGYNTEGPAAQRDAIVLAILGASIAVTGAALFLRYSLAQFLRFWLARLIYEQQTQTDRVVDAARR